VDINIPEVAVEIPEVEGPDIDIQKPTLDLLDFSGLLGGLALGLSSSGRKRHNTSRQYWRQCLSNTI
jgi:hypothetical protein